jgi:hypothetical protein
MGCFFIAEPRKTSPPYGTAASTGKLRDTFGVREYYNKTLRVFRVEETWVNLKFLSKLQPHTFRHVINSLTIRMNHML